MIIEFLSVATIKNKANKLEFSSQKSAFHFKCKSHGSSKGTFAIRGQNGNAEPLLKKDVAEAATSDVLLFLDDFPVYDTNLEYDLR